MRPPIYNVCMHETLPSFLPDWSCRSLANGEILGLTILLEDVLQDSELVEKPTRPLTPHLVPPLTTRNGTQSRFLSTPEEQVRRYTQSPEFAAHARTCMHMHMHTHTHTLTHIHIDLTMVP